MPLFFPLKRPVSASIDIVALTGTVGYLAHTWSKINDKAAYALVPYLAWLSFATYLCIGTGYLNNWNFHGKEVPKADKPASTKFVDEKP
jgi:benzodiazapine receptor